MLRELYRWVEDYDVLRWLGFRKDVKYRYFYLGWLVFKLSGFGGNYILFFLDWFFFFICNSIYMIIILFMMKVYCKDEMIESK